MATEASVTDQTADKHVEEMKVSDDTKHADEESVSQPKDLEGKDKEEKLKVEDSASAEASVTEQEEKPEDKKIDALVEEVKMEEVQEESAGEVIEKESESEAVEKPVENLEASFVQESEAEAAKEPAVLETVAEEVKTKELPSASETEDKATESVIPTVAEPASDVTGAPDASESAEISPDAKILAEVEVSPESSKEEPTLDETSVQATAASDSLDAIAVDPAEVNELKDAGAVVPEVPDVPEKTDANPNADGSVEESVKEESGSSETEVLKESTEIKEKEEMAMEGEEPILSETSKTDAATEVAEVSFGGGGDEKAEEKGENLEGDKTSLVEASKDLDAATEVAEVEEKDSSLEGDKTTLVETSRDLDVDSTVKEPVIDSKEAESELKPAEAIETVTDKLVNERAVNVKYGGDTQTEGEAPKQEVPTKPSQRQSNNIISKVKQSIVKVKKAIIGKSPSSKTMSSEGKDDIKVK